MHSIDWNNPDSIHIVDEEYIGGGIIHRIPGSMYLLHNMQQQPVVGNVSESGIKCCPVNRTCRRTETGKIL